MPMKPYSWSRCRCDIPPTGRLSRRSSRGRSDFPRWTASVERLRKILDLYGRNGKRYFDKKRSGHTKCALCSAAAVSAVRRERRAIYRRLKGDAKEKKRASADNPGREDSAEKVKRDAAHQILRSSIAEETSLQDLSGGEKMEEGEEASDEVYYSDDTIKRPIYSDYTPNESYEEGEVQQSLSRESQDSNSESINHDEQRWPPPKSPLPSGRSETPSSASESQSSADGDDEDDEETKERKERKERNFRRKEDQKYLVGLSRLAKRILG